MRSAIFMWIVMMFAVMLMSSCATSQLENRVKQLEDRVGKLEKTVAPLAAKAEDQEAARQQRMLARMRMRKDRTVYSPEQLREIERLYQAANKNWKSQEAKENLKKLIERFPRANRTGCALLYLGQMSKGKEREEYLKKAIDGYSDCFYGDGVQVGAYARFYLAFYYMRAGQKKKAKKLFEEIIRKYPYAINHRGAPLSKHITKIMSTL